VLEVMQQQIPFGDDNKKSKRNGKTAKAAATADANIKSKGSHGGCLCFDAGLDVYAGEGWFSP